VRAAVEYSAATVEIASVDDYLRRHSETNALENEGKLKVGP